MFESVRRSRGKGGMNKPVREKITHYVRYIVMLPHEFLKENRVSIPRYEKRTMLPDRSCR